MGILLKSLSAALIPMVLGGAVASADTMETVLELEVPATGATIPDDTDTTYAFTLATGLFPILESLTVQIAIRHEELSDITIFLVSPQGTQLILAQRNTTFGEVEYRDTIFKDDEQGVDHPLITDGSPPLTAIFNPLTPLSTIMGENPNGLWQLVIIDDQPFDQGSIYRPGSTVSWASSPSPTVSQGTKITIVSIPEPASAMLLLAGAGCLMGRNRRRA